MANILYSLPSDNIAAEVTPTVDEGTVDPDYPVANLVDLNPARPCKLSTQTGAFLWNFGSAHAIDLIAIINHNLDAGLTVYLQGNASDSWGAPSINHAITIPTWWEDGMPVNPLLDISDITNRSFQYWRLVVSGTNTSPVRIGNVMLLTTARRVPCNIRWGFSVIENRPIVEHVTDYRVSTIYSYGISQRTVAGNMALTEAGVTSLRSWFRACGGRALPFLFQLEGGDINDCWLARFTTTTLEFKHEFTDYNTLSIGFEEVGRGLPL